MEPNKLLNKIYIIKIIQYPISLSFKIISILKSINYPIIPSMEESGNIQIMSIFHDFQ